MIRTGEQYIESIRDGREVFVNGERVKDAPTHPMFKPPQEQDPDFLLHVVKGTDAGIVVRGATYETAAAYANQAFSKPTVANWGSDQLSDYAVGFICDRCCLPV